MTLDVGKKYQRSRHRRRWWRMLLAIPILASVGVLGLLLYDAATSNSRLDSVQSYSYSVDQRLTYDVSYFENNYFDQTATSARQTAYVRELTDTVTANFAYLFKTEEPTELSYTYAATAQVIASYTPKGTSEQKTVWDASYPLIKTVSKDGDQGVVRIDAAAVIPFHTYSQRVAQMNSGLALALDAKVIVTFSVAVSGKANELPVNEQRTMQLTIPLDQSIYTVATEYEQRDAKTITADDNDSQVDTPWWRTNRTILVIVSVVVLIGSVTLFVRPWQRREIERNPYKRELHRIYRYHDGLIIRTQKPLDLKGREGLSVASFDDLLNLSEELRTPIIASELSEEGTHFIVLHEAMVYSFLLGRVPTSDTPPPTVASRSRKRTATKR